MTNTNHENNQAPLINGVNDPIVTDSHTKPVLIDAGEFFDVGRERLFGELEKPPVDPLLGDSVERR